MLVMCEKDRSGFNLGHDLVEVLQTAESTQEIDDAVRVFNEAYRVLRRQLEDKERIFFYGRDRF